MKSNDQGSLRELAKNNSPYNSLLEFKKMHDRRQVQVELNNDQLNMQFTLNTLKITPKYQYLPHFLEFCDQVNISRFRAVC